MGMFDNVWLKEPVVCKCGHKQYDFQTKQFSNMMECYKVSKKGGLYIEDYRIRDAKPSKQTAIGNGKKKIKLPLWVKERKGWKKLKRTTTLHCYSYCHGCSKYWLDVLLEYYRGQLKSKKIKKRKL